MYSGHSDRVNALAWSPDSKRIASGSSDKTVQVWLPGS
ncbi:WD40 repeat domain-containing protein [Dictyobacter kobayashii]